MISIVRYSLLILWLGLLNNSTPVGAVGTGIESGGKQTVALQRATSVIRRQVMLEKTKNKAILDTTADEEMVGARSEVRLVEQRLQSDVERFYNNHPITINNAQDQSFLQWREHEVQQMQNRSKDEQDKLLRVAKERAARYGKIGAMRASALDQVADNLERQMSENPGISGVRLLPQGTDLYVRRYASVQPTKTIPDAHSAVVRVYSRQLAGDEPVVDRARAYAPARLQRGGTVRGKLLD